MMVRPHLLPPAAEAGYVEVRRRPQMKLTKEANRRRLLIDSLATRVASLSRNWIIYYVLAKILHLIGRHLGSMVG